VLGYAPAVVYVSGQPYRDSPLILTLEYAPMFAWRLAGYAGFQSGNLNF
jgi:hypothetical protein